MKKIKNIRIFCSICKENEAVFSVKKKFFCVECMKNEETRNSK